LSVYFDDSSDSDYERGFNDGFVKTTIIGQVFMIVMIRVMVGIFIIKGDQIPQVASPEYDVDIMMAYGMLIMTAIL
jgi:hypothetical protein